MKTNPSTRRSFLASSATAAAGAATVAGLSTGGFFSSTAQADSKKKLGVALVGLGNLSTHQLAPALLKTEGCELTAIVTGSPEKEKAWTAKYGISPDHVYNYENFDKIASDDSIDLVYIVLPNSMHHEFTIRAAKAGKHVLCEKPMANTAQECREMIAACQAADRQLAVGYRCQFEPHHAKAQEIVRSVEFGPIQRIDAGFAFKIGDPNQWRLNKELAGGGALMDIGIYALQFCRFMTGEEPTTITASETKTNFDKFAQVDESIAWRMDFASGIHAYCQTSYSLNGINSGKVYGQKSSLSVEPAYSYEGNQLHRDGKKVALQQIDQFANEMDNFARCIREGKPSQVSGEEGLKDLLAVEAIYRSIAEGKQVSVEKV